MYIKEKGDKKCKIKEYRYSWCKQEGIKVEMSIWGMNIIITRGMEETEIILKGGGGIWVSYQNADQD
jgi:hypothetical protein